MIEVQDLTKTYGFKTAVNRLSFTVEDGEIMGFLGPNGAGKSTTMNVLTGYLSATEGSVFIDGIDLLEEPFLAKKRLGYLPENPPLYKEMTVLEYLLFVYELKKLRGGKQAAVREVMERTGLSEVKHRLIANLSKGYRQRVGMAGAVLGYPPVIILDEPTIGLDPNQILDMRSFIQELGGKHTVLLSSHILSEVEAVCTRVLLIHEGKKVALGSPNELKKQLSSGQKLRVRVDGDGKKAASLLKKLGEVREEPSGEEGTSVFLLTAQSGGDIRRKSAERLRQGKVTVLEMSLLDESLEDVFHSLTKREEKEEAPGFNEGGGEK